MCEVLDMKQESGTLRLYCENISASREQDIITNLGIKFISHSVCNEQYDGALILDFDANDLKKVKLYFGDNDG